MRHKKIKPLYKWLLIFGGIVFIFLLWWILHLALHTTLLPGPWETFCYLGNMLLEGSTWLAIWNTVYRLIISFVISFILGLILGIISGIWEQVYLFLRPLVTILRTVPTAAVIYILIVLTRVEAAIYIICCLLIFPLIYEAVYSGIHSIDDDVYNSLRLDGRVYRPRAIWSVFLPLSRPYISLGVVQSIGLGMKVCIMAEILCGNPRIKGLGRLIYYASQYVNMKEIISIAIICIVLIAIVDVACYFIKKTLPVKKLSD